MKIKAKKNRPEKKVVIKVSPNKVQKLSTWDLLKKAFASWIDRKTVVKKSIINPNGMMPDPNQWKDITFLAIVVDGEVVDVMRVQPRMASVLLHQPTFVEFNPKTSPYPPLGTKYEDGKFVYPTPPLHPQEFKMDKSNEN